MRKRKESLLLSFSWACKLCNGFEADFTKLTKWHHKFQEAQRLTDWQCFRKYGRTKKQLAKKVQKLRYAYFFYTNH